MQLTDAQMRLYAITDDRWLNGRTLYDCVEDALKGGVTMLQIREKHCSTGEIDCTCHSDCVALSPLSRSLYHQ